MDKRLQQIRAALGHMTMKWKPTAWLDTGIPDLNEALGDRDFGIPFGKIIEIFGWESQGKSTIVMALAALAQLAGAFIVWIDLENSFMPKWALQRGFAPCPKCKGEAGRKNGIACTTCGGSLEESLSPTRGLDTDKLLLIQPYVGQFTAYGKDGKPLKKKEERLTYGQELLEEAELGMSLPEHSKRVVVIDSVSAVLPEGEQKAGLSNANMRSDMELSKLMGRVLRRWAGLAQVHNALIVLVNQLREGGPGYGGEKTPGGAAPKFYAHSRAKVRRTKGSRIIDKGKVIGIVGLLQAVKNKSGGDEGMAIGYRIMKKGSLEFIAAKEAKKNEENA